MISCRTFGQLWGKATAIANWAANTLRGAMLSGNSKSPACREPKQPRCDTSGTSPVSRALLGQPCDELSRDVDADALSRQHPCERRGLRRKATNLCTLAQANIQMRPFRAVAQRRLAPASPAASFSTADATHKTNPGVRPPFNLAAGPLAPSRSVTCILW